MKNKLGTKSANTNLIIWIVVLLIALAIMFLVALVMRNATETDQFYVLNTPVAAKSQITPEMLEPMNAVKDQAPPNALGISDIQAGGIYAQYPLNKGDIVSGSNVSGFTDISTGIPDNWVVTNFPVSPDNAVGGRITRGTYFDIMAYNKDKGAYYPFVNVLALDTTVSTNSLSSAQAIDTPEAQDGQTQQYYVGMSPQDAGKLQALMSSGDQIKLVLSPRQNEYQNPDLNAYKGFFKYENDKGEAIWPGKSAGGEITDYTFSKVERDEFGRPLQGPDAGSIGNAGIPANGNSTAPTEDAPEESASPSASESTPSESASPSASPTS